MRHIDTWFRDVRAINIGPLRIILSFTWKKQVRNLVAADQDS